MSHARSIRSLWANVRDFWSAMRAARVFGLAAEMAFWLFLSIVPLAVVIGLVLARLAVRNVDAVAQLLSALPLATRDLFAGELRHVASWNGGTVGAPAVAVFLWFASNGAYAIFRTLEHATGASRAWWKRRLLAIVTCVALSVSVAVLALVVSGLDWVADVLSVSLAQSSFLKQAIRWILGPLCTIGIVAWLYLVGVPSHARKRIPIVHGAVFAVALQFVTGFGYKVFLAEFGAASAYQAGLTAIAVTLTALYLFAAALLVGVQLNVFLADAAVRKSDPVD